MPQKVVEEWAEFLDDEKIIKIEYKFATAYLVVRETDMKEVKDEKKEFQNKKEGLLRQFESTRSYIENQVQKINEFKVDLEEIKSEIEREFGKDSNEFKKLGKYELLKQAIIQDIEKQKGILSGRLLDIDSSIKREQNKYDQLVKEINLGKALIAKEKSDDVEIKQMQGEITKKLELIKKSIEKIQNDIIYERKVHSLEQDVKGFFSGFAEYKVKKAEDEKKRYYGALHDNSKLEQFNKLIGETQAAILKQDVKLSRDLYIELKSCLTAIQTSELSQENKSGASAKLYNIYNLITNMYKEQSYDKSKQLINTKISEANGMLNEVKQGYDSIKGSISHNAENQKFTDEYLKKFVYYANSVSKDMDEIKKRLDFLFKKKVELDKNISGLENEVMNKVLSTRGKFEERIHSGEGAMRYQKLFERKAELERMIIRINQDKQSLENELSILIKKAQALELSQSKNMELDIEEIKTLMNDIDVRKKEFEAEVTNFNNLVLSN